jgi:hypothetical protein
VPLVQTETAPGPGLENVDADGGSGFVRYRLVTGELVDDSNIRDVSHLPGRRTAMSMLRTYGLALTALFALAPGIATSSASTKFTYTHEVTPAGDLIVNFEEGSLKRFDGVDYQIDATATSFLGTCDNQAMMQTFPTATVALTPNNGRVTGTLTALLDLPQVFACQRLLRVEYMDVTLTNLTSGHVYRLDPISRTFP